MYKSITYTNDSNYLVVVVGFDPKINTNTQEYIHALYKIQYWSPRGGLDRTRRRDKYLLIGGTICIDNIIKQMRGINNGFLLGH